MVTNRTALKNEIKEAGLTENDMKVATLDLLYDYGKYGKIYIAYNLELDEDKLYYELTDQLYYVDYTDELKELKHESSIYPNEAIKTFFKAENTEPIRWGQRINYTLPVSSWFELDEDEYQDVQGEIYFILNE